MQSAGFERRAQRLALTEQMLLADHLGERARPQTFGERSVSGRTGHVQGQGERRHRRIVAVRRCPLRGEAARPQVERRGADKPL